MSGPEWLYENVLKDKNRNISKDKKIQKITKKNTKNKIFFYVIIEI